MKPAGLQFVATGGALVLRMSPSNRALDAIWNAVQEATLAGMTVEQFRREAAQAWDHELDQQRKEAARQWSKP